MRSGSSSGVADRADRKYAPAQSSLKFRGLVPLHSEQDHCRNDIYALSLCPRLVCISLIRNSSYIIKQCRKEQEHRPESELRSIEVRESA